MASLRSKSPSTPNHTYKKPYGKYKSNWSGDRAFEDVCMNYLKSKTPILKDLNCQEFVTDLSVQKSGIDFIGTLNGREIAIDVKSIATNEIPTFCFEVAGNVHSGQIGWLINEDLKTTHILLTYHEVEGYERNYNLAKRNMTLNNVTETVAYLVDKQKLIDAIKLHLKSNDLSKVVEQIRNDAPNFAHANRSVKFFVSNNSVYPYDRFQLKGAMVYLTLSAQLYEQPINVVVRREILEDIAEKIWHI